MIARGSDSTTNTKAAGIARSNIQTQTITAFCPHPTKNSDNIKLCIACFVEKVGLLSMNYFLSLAKIVK